jgi:mannitol/fructose-specific phosphotransferase system IIA component
MINNLKNVDVVNIRNMQKKRKEHSDMEEILKKRIKEEKINRDYINNILERNQVITNLILKK